MANYDDVKKVANAKISANQTNANNAAQQAYAASISQANALSAKSKTDALSNYRDAKDKLSGASNTTINKLEASYTNAVGRASAAASSAQANAKSALSKATASNNANAANATGKVTESTGKAQAEKEYTDKKRKQAEKDERANMKYDKKRQKDAMKDTKRQRNMKVYNDTIGRFDTVKKCDAAIKKLKKSNDPNKEEKIAYIGAQRAKLKQAKKAEASSRRRGGWGRRGYGRRWSNNRSTATEEYKGGDTGDNGANDFARALLDIPIYATKTMLDGAKKTEGKAKKAYKSVARKREHGRRHWHL